MRTVIFLGLFLIHDAIVILAVSNGYVRTASSNEVIIFLATTLLVVMVMDIVDFFRVDK